MSTIPGSFLFDRADWIKARREKHPATPLALELLLGTCLFFPWLHPLNDSSLRKSRAGSLHDFSPREEDPDDRDAREPTLQNPLRGHKVRPIREHVIEDPDLRRRW